MILLITNQRDLTMDYIVRDLRLRKIPFFRLNTETIYQYKCRIGNEHIDDWSIGTINGQQVSAAYFRRPGIPAAKLSTNNVGISTYVSTEWQAFLKSIYARLENKWFSSPVDITLAEDKPKQLLLAKQLGFAIPKNTITNDIDTAKSLEQNISLIAKPLRQALLEDEEEKVIFTNRINQLTESDAEPLSAAPVIFQQEISKKYDVRVTVVGESVFATAIFSQDYAETVVDWRRGGHCELVHKIIELPIEIEKRCIELTKLLNLRFGAIDFICDTSDNYWFLEINPNGQWAWIENQTQAPIANSIVSELLKIGESQL
jgi:glutathione synthase/RimK-type ligase-like ATP-grasp enzyme